MFVSRSSFENPRPLERFCRTVSPSSTSIADPRASTSSTTSLLIVVFPAPESPVNQSVNPCSSAISVRLLSIRDYQDLRNLFPGELVRRCLARRQHLAHLCTGKEQVRVLLVGAGLVRGHPLARLAPEGVLEEQRLDAQLPDVDLVED